MEIRFESTASAEDTLDKAVNTIVGWCDALDKQLSS